MNARKQAIDLGYEIASEIDEGECFYDKDELYGIIGRIEKLKLLIFKAYEETEKETREDY